MEPPPDISDDDMTDDEDSTVNELTMRLSSVVDVTKSLYIMGFKIRNPMLRPSPVKAGQYREVDPETSVDVFGAYAEFDRRHVQAMLLFLRRELHPTVDATEDSGYLATRLAASITTRRRHFRYWEKHAQKLSLHAPAGVEADTNPARAQSSAHQPTSEGNAGLRHTLEALRIAESKTIPSVTEATKFEDRTDAETVISHTSTALDVDGYRLELPKPPQDALQGKDFVCPYCSVICPAKYGQSKAWRLEHGANAAE
jgi:hypothetical protein